MASCLLPVNALDQPSSLVFIEGGGSHRQLTIDQLDLVVSLVIVNKRHPQSVLERRLGKIPGKPFVQDLVSLLQLTILPFILR
ncbi:hypothetical protein [Nitrosococcus oceani]|uniref:Uncharacterized protein n=1 Tax=Nitrosococcus oceani C-27 TaxID=314279 RepID=A0A0E2Z627_9GAMM|nr:hypothetical protein [Nitrosococcus oceani]KFI20894.1 hypothetical protein IB75_00525 [Nitrosococcus oceani C-27]